MAWGSALVGDVLKTIQCYWAKARALTESEVSSGPQDLGQLQMNRSHTSQMSRRGADFSCSSLSLGILGHEDAQPFRAFGGVACCLGK